MSESAVILEGEVARRFNPVDKLRATNQDSSVSDWVPSDTLDLGSLMASENTLYLANIDDDCDAYEEVEVDVSEELEDGDYKKITGKGNDGNDYAVGLDENGNLTSEMVPSAIHIVIKPRKLEYKEGETLDFTGIHVYLMDGNNQRFTSEDYPTGEIPFEELVFPVTVASGGDNYQEAVIGKQSIKYQVGGSVTITGHEDTYDYDFSYTYSGADYLVCFDQGSTVLCLFVVTSPKNITRIVDATFDGGRHSEEVYPVSADRYTQINHIPYGYFPVAHSSRNGGIPWGIVEPPFENNPYNFGTVLLEGDTSGLDGNTIPVQWIRTDGKQLEDAFSIAVTNNVQSDISNSGSGHTGGGF